MKIFAKSAAVAAVSVLCLATSISAYADPSMVVVVSANSPVSALTTDQVAQVFLGKLTVLPGSGPVILVDQPEGAVIRDSFYTKLASKNSAQMKALWSRLTFSGAAQPPKAVADDGEVKRAVAASVSAIGYIDKGSADSSVKVVLSLN